MKVSHTEQLQLAAAQVEYAEMQDSQAARMVVTAIECIKTVDLTAGVMRIILDSLSHKVSKSNMSHTDYAQTAIEHIDDAAFAFAETENFEHANMDGEA